MVTIHDGSLITLDFSDFIKQDGNFVLIVEYVSNAANEVLCYDKTSFLRVAEAGKEFQSSNGVKYAEMSLISDHERVYVDAQQVQALLRSLDQGGKVFHLLQRPDQESDIEMYDIYLEDGIVGIEPIDEYRRQSCTEVVSNMAELVSSLAVYISNM